MSDGCFRWGDVDWGVLHEGLVLIWSVCGGSVEGPLLSVLRAGEYDACHRHSRGFNLMFVALQIFPCFYCILPVLHSRNIS